MTPPPRIDIIRIAAPTHREAGRRLGEAARDRLHAEAAEALDDLPAGRTPERQRELAAEYRAFTEPRLPWLVEELDGIAEARRPRPADVLRRIDRGALVRAAGTVTAGPVQRPRGGAHARPPTATCSSAHTNDLRPRPSSTSWAREAHRRRPDDLPARRHPVAGVGWNDAGLSLTGNELTPNDERLGISRSPPGARDDARPLARRDGVDVASPRPRLELQQRAHVRRRRRRQRRGKRHRRRGDRPRRRRPPRAHEPLRLRSHAGVRRRPRLRRPLGGPLRAGAGAHRRAAAQARSRPG